ncbi:MAG: UDP-N-acetylglucosamine 2-epimerase (non-hydrolyzing) [Deltaproteobacteria bacterium]|nr:UDP-N-acetylglucosamine 2-epimerase (non-hydrolyzing) [Deltaproteobacteria bacterium]
MRVLSIFGTRPEAIKMAPVLLCLEQDKRFETKICNTSQHKEMVQQVLSFFKITPDYDLQIMTKAQNLTDLTSRILNFLTPVVRQCEPDTIIVQGDTTTTFAASLVAFYEKIPVAHVEAGLRTYGKLPFPEEANRRITSCLASFHFASTRANADNLKREGIPESTIWITGNTVLDSLNLTMETMATKSPVYWENKFGVASKHVLSSSEPILLITCHRRESIGTVLDQICEAIIQLAKAFPRVRMVYPVHPNPPVQKQVREKLRGIDNILLIDPLEYEPFIFLMKRADLILTDSGGIQEEATALGKTALVMRDVTERPEAIQTGLVRLVGTHTENIVSECTRLLEQPPACVPSHKENPFGDGQASRQIVEILAEALAGKRLLKRAS